MTETDPEKRLMGYARVSTYGQTLDTQLEQLRAAGCSSRNIYREKVTGARADRRELLRMLDRLAPGDMVTVTRIDRLARPPLGLFAIVKRIVEAGGQFRSLAAPWADTGTSTVSRCRETLKSSSDRQARFVAWELILAPINNARTPKPHRKEVGRNGAINCDIANSNI